MPGLPVSFINGPKIEKGGRGITPKAQKIEN